ncbi:rhesus-like protein [Camelus ferus]|nr:rhesus-like protein [Camelus ferus]
MLVEPLHRDGHRMGSKYQQSLWGCLPLWALLLEVALILIFLLFTSYDTSSKDQKDLLGTFRAVIQDVILMAALGLGFLNTSLRRHCWSSVAFNLFLLALGVQFTVLLDGFLKQLSLKKIVINLSSVQMATMSATSVLISAGTVLGKVNLVQLVLMMLIELTAFSTTRIVGKKLLNMDNHISMMYIHVFAAYFGLTASYCLPKPPKEMKQETQMATSPSLFAMLGTLFLWIFWPSFNSSLLDLLSERKKAVFNTYYALAVSAVTAILVSALVHSRGKINMIHIHNAVLAGGVAVGPACYLIPSPWLAMLLGLMAGLISILEAKYLSVCFQMLNIHDTYGVHYTFGLPGLLGGIIYVVLMAHQVMWTDISMVRYQVLTNLGALSFSVIMGMVFGLLTGQCETNLPLLLSRVQGTGPEGTFPMAG